VYFGKLLFDLWVRHRPTDVQGRNKTKPKVPIQYSIIITHLQDVARQSASYGLVAKALYAIVLENTR